MVEELDDVIEQIADKLAFYGSHPENMASENCECRTCFVSGLNDRIRSAIEREKNGPGDTKRLEWVLPILSLAEGPTDERAIKIAGALMIGKSGREGLDLAMGE